jgi:glycosyltransferase involved in cell wall biosynthesis
LDVNTPTRRDAVRIGVMLRTWDEKGGVGVYTQNVVRELIGIDRRNHYVLYYRNTANLGTFSGIDNVTERVVRAPNKAWWDQVAIPWACLRDRVDVLFHPKFTVPLLAPCATVMVVHGADWFMPDQSVFYKPLDVRYIRTVMPWYFRKAAVVISVSQLTTENFRQVLRFPADKIRTVYFGPAKHFHRIEDPMKLNEVSSRYGLPERFILTLTKLGGDDRKNFGNIIEAYRRYHVDHPDPLELVVGGKDCGALRETYRIPTEGWGRDVRFPGWLDQRDLPAIYSVAEAYLYASNLEAFPIPLTEAMACGTPIVTSSVNGLEEIADEAAVLVDPRDPQAIADALARVLNDEQLRRDLSRRGLERASRFTWEKCGRETLRILESVGGLSR